MKTELLSKLKLIPLEFEKIDKRGKIGDVQTLIPGKRYVCLIAGRFLMGTFVPIWFGLNFHCGSNYQFDPYLTNGTDFQAIWAVEGDEVISATLETSYAEWQKKYCVEHHLTRGGVPITADDSIELFRYFHNRPSCENDSDGDNDVDEDEDDTDYDAMNNGGRG